ncbi:MAG: hypothetical protein Q8893_02630 [Candidatus Phytoplasma australasiaticum]|nr:hypothetical protein [Candidatus Phytoplasma australasiaticum]
MNFLNVDEEHDEDSISVSINSPLETNVFEMECESESESCASSSENNLKTEILDWSNKFEIPHNALGDLLNILRKYEIGENLPKDPRTLRGTPRNSIIKSMGKGEYCHFGLENGIKKL